ncbi:hypothetical protein F4778DRAFT_739205 [Xylariomycetidae sp. FL2044]|nr:hypothetical protein F4778DRAFT_739205 [Xylariomycetidae sp. FL2044]
MDTGRFSFGYEGECLVAFVHEGKLPPTPAMFQGHTGHPIVVPKSHIQQEYSYVLQRVYEVINSSLTRRADTRLLSSDLQGIERERLSHLAQYDTWRPTFEIIDPPEDLRAKAPGFDWIPVEIVAPALWAVANSFQELRDVCDIVRGKFWTATPNNCGLHIHVGYGLDWFPLPELRRMAALLYVADPILTQLHPAHRRTYGYCYSARLYSELTHGLTLHGAERRVGRADVDAEIEYPLKEDKDTVADLSAMSQAKGCRFVRRIPRGKLAGYPEGDAAVLEVRKKQQPSWRHAFTLLHATNCETVGALMDVKPRSGWSRGAYNFSQYAEGAYGRRDHKRTIEFRQPAGTLDADEVVAQARVCVRLCEWAATADMDAFWPVVMRCSEGEATGKYDALDLLTDLDLVDEAETLQSILLARDERPLRKEGDERPLRKLKEE